MLIVWSGFSLTLLYLDCGPVFPLILLYLDGGPVFLLIPLYLDCCPVFRLILLYLDGSHVGCFIFMSWHALVQSNIEELLSHACPMEIFLPQLPSPG